MALSWGGRWAGGCLSASYVGRETTVKITVSVSGRVDAMKTPLDILGALVVVVVLVAVSITAFAIWDSVAKGYTTWYFRVNGRVTVDGHKTTGYMHANTQRTVLLLTRTDGRRPETYLVSLGDEKAILDCGKWHPTRFLPFPIGHVNPPCSIFTVEPADVADAPVSATLVRERRSIEFSTASGKKVKAEW